jgi:hypothetical protein
MKCKNAIDLMYDRIGEEVTPFGKRLSLAFHILFCDSCAGDLSRLEHAREILRTGFIPPSPDFEDAIMNSIYAEEAEDSSVFDMPGGVSTRGWVIVGLLILFSLMTIFFGRDFLSIAKAQGSSFLLPLGITIGLIITAYGALFIGSHLKELMERFRLR